MSYVPTSRPPGPSPSKSDASSTSTASVSTASGQDKEEKPQRRRGKFMAQLKDWISTSEPSTQALKQHKKATYMRAGVTPRDPNASARLHIPVGTIPGDAIKPSGKGPEPEEIARRKAEEMRALRGACADFRRTTSRSDRSFSIGSGHSEPIESPKSRSVVNCYQPTHREEG